MADIERNTETALLSVLIVEDNAADARLVKELLLEPGTTRFATTQVAHMRGALECLLSSTFHAIVLDLGLPDSQGLETLSQARAAARGAPIIVLTGFDDEAQAISAVLHGAQDYLVKGAVTAQLLRRSLVYAIERAKVDASLMEREARFRQLTENMKEVFFVVDARFRETLYISPAYEQVWGRSCQSLYERPASFLDAVLPEDVAAVRANVALIQGGADAGEVEFRLKTPEGNTRSILARTVAVRDEAGDVYRIAGVCTDVTEKHNLERQFRQAQKMEAVGRLAGGVAHDFNNLLTVISSYASLLIADHSGNGALRDDLEQILKASSSAASLTRQLLAFSRQQVLEPRALDLNEVVRNAERMLKRVIGEDVRLEVALGENLGRVHADFGQIEQVIMNLAVNARDAMPNGGQLTIETVNVELTDQYADEHFAMKPGSYVMLAVSDSGEGMSDATKGNIFEPFFTTKEAGKGTGLGLSTVYGIVQQSAGSIWVYSEVGKGTTFKIYLPRIDAPADPVVPAPALVSARGTETVLVVEDVEALRDVVRRVLERNGYTVLEAADARGAVAVAGDYPGPIHLLLSDVVLPGESGRELAEELSKVRPGLRVLFTSGYTDDAVIRRDIVARGAAFMQKPFTPEIVERRVREVLDAAPD